MSKVVTRIEAMDYMSQLASGIVMDYKAGVIINYLDQTADYGGIIYAVIEDDTHIYVGGATTQTIRKYLKSTLALVAESPDYGGTIYALTEDDTHVYAGGETPAPSNEVKKYLKSTMAYVSQSPGYGGTIRALAIDDTHIYAGGETTQTIRKHLKSTMAYVDQSPSYGGTIYALAIDDTHIYAGGETAPSNEVKKYLKSTMAYVSESPSYGGPIYALAIDDTHIYVGGATTQTIRKYLKSTLALVTESPGYGGVIQDLIIGSPYIYAGGSTTQKIHRFLLSDLTFNDESANYGGTIFSLAQDGSHIYVGGATTQKAQKFKIFDTVDEVIDALLAYPMQLPAVTKGTIAPIYADAVRPIEANGQSILQVLLTLRDTLGGYIEVNNDRELDWSETIGENKGQQIRYRKNLLGINREIDYSRLFNRIFVYGKNTVSGKVKLSDIQAEDYIEDTDSQTTWGGVYVGVFVNLSIASPYALLEWAGQLLEQHKDPPITYSINVVDLSVHPGLSFEKLQLGSQVKVIDEDLGIDVSAAVVRIYKPNLLNPQDMQVELANAVRNITDTLAGVASKTAVHDLLLTAS